MPKELPRHLALAQLRLRSITAGLAIDVATLPVEAPDSLSIDDGRNGFHYDVPVTVARYPKDGYGAARVISISIRELLALARLESDHPARAPIWETPPRLSAPPLTGEQPLGHLLGLVKAVMTPASWVTLQELQDSLWEDHAVRAGLPCISARLRDLRKPMYGGHTVDREQVPGTKGLFRYRLTLRSQA